MNAGVKQVAVVRQGQMGAEQWNIQGPDNFLAMAGDAFGQKGFFVTPLNGTPEVPVTVSVQYESTVTPGAYRVNYRSTLPAMDGYRRYTGTFEIAAE